MQHIVIDGVVVNTIMATPEEAVVAFPDATILDAGQGGAIGWLWDGQQLAAPPAPQEALEVPEVVTRFQALAALDSVGLLDAVEAYMAGADTPKIQKLAWANAVEFRRNSPTVSALSARLGLTNEQVDTLFVKAAGLEA